jgi:hypothetical protein
MKKTPKRSLSYLPPASHRVQKSRLTDKEQKEPAKKQVQVKRGLMAINRNALVAGKGFFFWGGGEAGSRETILSWFFQFSARAKGQHAQIRARNHSLMCLAEL